MWYIIVYCCKKYYSSSSRSISSYSQNLKTKALNACNTSLMTLVSATINFTEVLNLKKKIINAVPANKMCLFQVFKILTRLPTN